MRQKRAKSYRKQMLVYQHTFKFREPYQVIVDDELVLECDKTSFDLEKGLARTLQAEVKPMITQCCMQALYLTKNQQAIEYAKGFERRRCGHIAPDSKPPHECIKSIVSIDGENKHRYVVASENERLRWSLRKIPGVPLVHMKRSVMIMEPLSVASARASQQLEKSKLHGGLNNVRVGTTGGVEAAEKEAEKAKQLKKKKGPKEPNPLSVKKKKDEKEKKKEGENANKGEDGEGKKKRRRKHKKATEGEQKNDEKNDEQSNEEHDEDMADASD